MAKKRDTWSERDGCVKQESYKTCVNEQVKKEKESQG